jgi:hypothetical protein
MTTFLVIQCIGFTLAHYVINVSVVNSFSEGGRCNKHDHVSGDPVHWAVQPCGQLKVK